MTVRLFEERSDGIVVDWRHSIDSVCGVEEAWLATGAQRVGLSVAVRDVVREEVRE